MSMSLDDRTSTRRLLRTGWPLTALLGLYPLWWILGLGSLAFIVFALPMAMYLLRHRPLRVPPGFGLWLLFLVWMLVSLLMFPFNPPGTTAGTTGGRVIGLSLNGASYLAATIALLYVVNVPRAELPQRKVLRLLSVLFVVTVAGGVLGVVAPHFEFVAPLEKLLPESVRSNAYTRALIHPLTAQLQDVLGSQKPRPAAPFGYTNFWGNNFSILLVWWVVWLWGRRSPIRRALGAGVCLVAVVPVIYSLNRAMWAGLALSLVYVIARRARVRPRSVGSIVVVLLAACSLLALTPLRSIIEQRAHHGKSNSLRAYLSTAAIDAAEHSPIIGYGGTRKTIGSNQSIAIGPTSDCPQCGSQGLGSNGQIWLIVVAQGFVGAALYVSFFLWIILAYARDRTPIGVAGVLVTLLSLFYMFFYNSLPVALVLTMISIGVVVRNGLPQEATRTVTATPMRRPTELLSGA